MARPGRPTAVIALSDSERETLQRWTRPHSAAQALASLFHAIAVVTGEAGVAAVFGFKGFDGECDAFGPFVALELIEVAAFLEVGEEDNG